MLLEPSKSREQRGVSDCLAADAKLAEEPVQGQILGANSRGRRPREQLLGFDGVQAKLDCGQALRQADELGTASQGAQKSVPAQQTALVGTAHVGQERTSRKLVHE